VRHGTGVFPQESDSCPRWLVTGSCGCGRDCFSAWATESATKHTVSIKPAR
jgi:hypothetical protein